MSWKISVKSCLVFVNFKAFDTFDEMPFSSSIDLWSRESTVFAHSFSQGISAKFFISVRQADVSFVTASKISKIKI